MSGPLCECDWKNCGHKGRDFPAADYGPGIRTSPELCTACVFCCEGERDDDADAAHLAPGGES